MKLRFYITILLLITTITATGRTLAEPDLEYVYAPPVLNVKIDFFKLDAALAYDFKSIINNQQPYRSNEVRIAAGSKVELVFNNKDAEQTILKLSVNDISSAYALELGVGDVQPAGKIEEIAAHSDYLFTVNQKSNAQLIRISSYQVAPKGHDFKQLFTAPLGEGERYQVKPVNTPYNFSDAVTKLHLKAHCFNGNIRGYYGKSIYRNRYLHESSPVRRHLKSGFTFIGKQTAVYIVSEYPGGQKFNTNKNKSGQIIFALQFNKVNEHEAEVISFEDLDNSYLGSSGKRIIPEIVAVLNGNMQECPLDPLEYFKEDFAAQQ